MDTKQCPICGTPLNQEGADTTKIYYHCVACGHNLSVSISNDEGNAEFTLRKREILSRVRMGFVDWRVTQWDRLQADLIDFMGRYESTQTDIQLQVAILACITKGFNVMDAEKYKQCKALYKMTEKIYKLHLKSLKKQMDPNLYESVSDYKESRTKYKTCVNQYRNTKMAWKVLFFFIKKLVPLGIG